MRELKMEEIQNKTEESRLRWFGHFKKMDQHSKISTGNKDEWKNNQEQSMNMTDIPSSERYRQERTIMEEGR
jgi:hypothetical protein